MKGLVHQVKIVFQHSERYDLFRMQHIIISTNHSMIRNIDTPIQMCLNESNVICRIDHINAYLVVKHYLLIHKIFVI